MTRKDYLLLADALKQSALGRAVMGDGWLCAVEAIADALKKSNPRFDRALFLKNCGVQTNA